MIGWNDRRHLCLNGVQQLILELEERRLEHEYC